jgi:hypothetical protein
MEPPYWAPTALVLRRQGLRFAAMSKDPRSPTPPGAAPGKPLTPAAKRALEEAAARKAAEGLALQVSVERGGPAGPEPTRYGDWERKGLAVDF